MRTIKSFIAAGLLLAVPVVFSSCYSDPWYDDDPWYGTNEPWWYEYNTGDTYRWSDYNYNNNSYSSGQSVLDEAEVLTGEWDGTMVYTNGDTGKKNRFNVNITFVRNSSNAIKGTGTEIDYLTDSQGNVTAQNQPLKFNWYINERTGDIHVKYLTQNGTTFVMDHSARTHGVYLDGRNGAFNGYMVGTNNPDMIQFDLRRVTNNNAKAAPFTKAEQKPSIVIGENIIEKVRGGSWNLPTRK